MDGHGTLETHLQHIHSRVVCDDCGPAIDVALAAASETGGQVTRLRDWLVARRPDEFDLSTDGTVVTGVLTLLDREGREWPSENDCRSIEVALRLVALAAEISNEWEIRSDAPPVLKRFGLDAATIVAAAVPPPAPEKKPAAKSPAKKKAGK